jgi:hypothetical protein
VRCSRPRLWHSVFVLLYNQKWTTSQASGATVIICLQDEKIFFSTTTAYGHNVHNFVITFSAPDLIFWSTWYWIKVRSALLKRTDVPR